MLINDLQSGGIGGLGAALLAGLLFSFTPVSLAAIPVVTAYVTKARAFRDALAFGAMFILGLLLTHVALGILAAASGNWVQKLMGPAWNLFTGPVLVLLGLLWLGWIRVPLPWLALRGRRTATLGGALGLGALFTLGICPVCSPGLWVAIGASASFGSIGYGAALLLLFAVGRAIPVMLSAASMGWLENLRPLSNWRRRLEAAGGCILMFIGFYVINDYYHWV